MVAKNFQMWDMEIKLDLQIMQNHLEWTKQIALMAAGH